MAFDGNGVFVIDTAGQPVVGGTTISSTAFNALTADLANGLTLCVTKDGQSTTTAAIPFAQGIETDALSPLTPNGPVELTAGQLEFPVVQNPSTDPNTLDDYEEGAWSPVVLFGGASVGQSVTANGYYTKIGNRVFYNCELSFANKGSSVGIAGVSGLPFTSSNVSAGRSPAAIYTDVMAGLSVPVAYVGPNSTVIALNNFAANTLASMTDANFTNTSGVAISGHYRV